VPVPLFEPALPSVWLAEPVGSSPVEPAVLPAEALVIDPRPAEALLLVPLLSPQAGMSAKTQAPAMAIFFIGSTP
jgi:hypothetical protein